MEPLFGPNTYLVIDPIEYEDLRSGMIVVYEDLSGRQIAHRLVSKEDGYWTVEGINNTFEDLDVVTADNLVGVVYGSFHGAR